MILPISGVVSDTSDMPIYVAVVNQKGGSGKTATAMNVCGALHKLGAKVLAVDADPQQSLSDWMQQSDPSRIPFALVSMAHPQLHVKLPEIADPAGYDFVVIDCPPGGQRPDGQGSGAMDTRDRITRSASLVSDMLLVPLQPKPTDFLAAARLRTLLIDLCTVKPDLQIAVMINNKKVGETMSRTARETAFELLRDDGVNLTILEAEIVERAVIAKSVASGVTVHDYTSTQSSERVAIEKAAADYISLAKEIQECLKTPCV